MTKKSHHQVSKINSAKGRQRADRRTQDTARLPSSAALPASFGYPSYVVLSRVTEQMFPDNVTASIVAALVVAALNLLEVVLSRQQAADAARRNRAAPSRAPRSR